MSKTSKQKRLHLPEIKMNEHFVSVGDSGVGKTQFNKQILYDAEACGDTCVVLDPKDQEYVREFFRPERGDIILNPKDARCPYWEIYKEFDDEAECLSLGRSMFPEHPSNPQAQFWDDYAMRLYAYIAATSNQPLDCEALANIFTSESEIAQRTKNREFGQLFDVEGGGSTSMRTSVLQTINQMGYALRMMPTKRETKRRFFIRKWAKERKGWIFLSSTEAISEAILSLQSAWVDMILNQLMSSSQNQKRVRVILDETDSLKQVPKLQRAMTKLRSSGNMMSLGFQNWAQLEDRYGKQAPTIFSQAGTKLIMRTSDGPSAKRLEELIGEVEMRYVRQSRTAGIGGGRERDSYSGPEEVRKPAVLHSQIQGLPALHGFLLQAPINDDTGLRVVRIKLPYYRIIENQPGLIPRTITLSQPPTSPTGKVLGPKVVTI